MSKATKIVLATVGGSATLALALAFVIAFA